MLGVLEIGFSGFLSFVGGGMWVLCGSFVDCSCFGFVFCVGMPGVEVCVFACFFSSASVSAEELHDVL